MEIMSAFNSEFAADRLVFMDIDAVHKIA